MTEQLDFYADDCGTVIVLTPMTDDARDWCREFLPEVAMFGDAFVIERRYFGDIARGIVDEAFTTNFVVDA